MTRSFAEAFAEAQRSTTPDFDITPYLIAAQQVSARPKTRDKGLDCIIKQAIPPGTYTQALAHSKRVKRFARAGLEPCEIAIVNRL